MWKTAFLSSANHLVGLRGVSFQRLGLPRSGLGGGRELELWILPRAAWQREVLGIGGGGAVYSRNYCKNCKTLWILFQINSFQVEGFWNYLEFHNPHKRKVKVFFLTRGVYRDLAIPRNDT